MMAVKTTEKKSVMISEYDLLVKVHRLASGAETGRRVVLEEIGRILDKEGIKPPRADRWTFSAVRNKLMEAKVQFGPLDGISQGITYVKGEGGTLTTKQISEIIYGTTWSDTMKVNFIKSLLEEKKK